MSAEASLPLAAKWILMNLPWQKHGNHFFRIHNALLCIARVLFPILEWRLSIQSYTYKSRGVVISDGLCITKGLQSRVTLDDLILQGSLKRNTYQCHCHYDYGKFALNTEEALSQFNNLFVIWILLDPTNSSNAGKVLNDSLGVHSLPSTRFST